MNVKRFEAFCISSSEDGCKLCSMRESGAPLCLHGSVTKWTISRFEKQISVFFSRGDYSGQSFSCLLIIWMFGLVLFLWAFGIICQVLKAGQGANEAVLCVLQFALQCKPFYAHAGVNMAAIKQFNTDPQNHNKSLTSSKIMAANCLSLWLIDHGHMALNHFLVLTNKARCTSF